MNFQRHTQFRPSEDNPRKCDRYTPNKEAIVLFARASSLKEESPTPKSQRTYKQAVDLVYDGRQFCEKTRRCAVAEECRKKIDQDLGICDESE